MDKLFISGLNRDLAILVYAKLQELFQATASWLKETLFLAMEKLMEQCLAGPILEGDNKGVKGLPIKICTDVSVATNPLVSAVAVVIVKTVVKNIAKAIVKVIAIFSVTANTSTKVKGEVEVKKDTFIKKQFYILLGVGILLFIMAGTLLIIFI